MGEVCPLNGPCCRYKAIQLTKVATLVEVGSNIPPSHVVGPRTPRLTYTPGAARTLTLTRGQWVAVKLTTTTKVGEGGQRRGKPREMADRAVALHE